jgi:hypothetical protein
MRFHTISIKNACPASFYLRAEKNKQLPYPMTEAAKVFRLRLHYSKQVLNLGEKTFSCNYRPHVDVTVNTVRPELVIAPKSGPVQASPDSGMVLTRLESHFFPALNLQAMFLKTIPCTCQFVYITTNIMFCLVPTSELRDKACNTLSTVDHPGKVPFRGLEAKCFIHAGPS